MKSTFEKVRTWKNITTASLVILSIITIFTISISVANFEKLKLIEEKINLIEQKIR